MSIATAIQNAQDRVAAAYTAVNTKGGTLPATQNLSNLPTAITSIPTSGGGSVGIPREVSVSGVYQRPSSSFTFTLPSNATDLGKEALYAAFRYDPITFLNLSSLTSISGMNALRAVCSYCSSLTSVNLSNIVTISGIGALGEAFFACSNLTSVDFSSLENLSNYNGGTFSYTFAFSSIQSISFPSLAYIEGDNHFEQMLSNVTGCTVHFPSNLQSVIGDWADVLAGFGGTNTTVLFDLPATA